MYGLAYPGIQNSPNALQIMVFGPKSLNVWEFPKIGDPDIVP